ncbi:DUF1120 domain-containing protein [Dyella sp. Tek66A03]|uniref:DUF1120 domain-containing protein n=1 Tax=Dyella sp. Tek66A03 TaxID=3458298 RepID=UPI00403EC2FC
MKLLKSVLASAMLAGSATAAFAGTTADISVTGTITPGSCTINIGNGGNFDVGTIPASSLNRGARTSLPPAHNSFSVNCEAPLRFALKGTDNRADSVDKWMVGGQEFGLGVTSANEKIGSFYLSLGAMSADGSVVGSTESSDGGTSSVGISSGAPYVYTDGTLVGFTTETGSNGPMAIQDLTGQLRANTTIRDADALTLTEAVPIDGSATIELVYL